MPQKMDLGGSWAPFGRGLGGSGASFGRSWQSLIRFLGVPIQAFFKHGAKMGSKKPFGSILGGFREGLGRNSGGFRAYWAGNGQILDMLSIIWPCWGKASKLDPRAASRSVTMRGGPPPAWLNWSPSTC